MADIKEFIEAYKKGIGKGIEVCDKELAHLNKWNYKKDEPAKTSVLFIKQQLQQLIKEQTIELK